MSEQKLPKRWKLSKVRDVLEIHYGKGLTKEERDSTGQVPVHGSNGVVGQHTHALVEGACIIIGRKGAAGSVHLSRVSCWPIDTTYYTQPSTELSLEYVYYALSYLGLNSLDKSTAIPSLSRDDLYSQTFPIPPLPEQHRIVAEIEKQFTRLDAGVAALKQVQTKLRRYRAAVLKAACEGKLVATEAELARAEGRGYEPAAMLLQRILAERRARWEAEQWAKGKEPQQVRYEEPVGPEVEGLPELPEGWVWTNFGSLFTVSIGGTPSRKEQRYWNGDIPWVSSGEVAFCRIKSTREQITVEGLANSNTKLNPPGTVLLAMIGEGKTRGQAAILDIAAANNQNVASILCSETPILPEWVFWWLMSRYEQTRRGGVASGGMQPALNSERVRALIIAIPPIAEQQRIVAEVERRLSVVAGIEATVEANLKRAERLRQAILKRAFEGRLVAQEAGDEPASVLLERIWAERAKREAGGPRPKKGTGKQPRLPFI